LSTNRKLCFVIMPFSRTTEKHTERYWTDHFQNFLRPLIEESSQLEARRSEPLRGDILKQIITDLTVSPIVIADLTDHNPNVFWELGVRQSFKYSTITIAEVGTALPFDVFGKGTLFYHDSHIGNEQFSSDFKKAITHCLTNPNSPDSSVLETLSGRGTLYEIIHGHEMLRRLDALVEECNWNYSLLQNVEKRVAKNKKNPKDKEYTTSRFMSAAVELLLIDRYLDEDKAFYETIGACFASIPALNDMLRNWRLYSDSVEYWFEENANVYYERFKKHKEVLIAAQKKLTERVSNVVL
jgi:hypothetical protein